MAKRALDSIHDKLFPGPVKRGNQTRVRIAEAVISHLHSDGLETLTFEAIGKRIGMNKAQIRYHFKSKEDLISRAIDYVIAVAQDIVLRHIDKATNWKTQLYAVTRGFFAWLDEYPSHGSVLLVLYYSASVSKERKEFHTRMTTMGFDRTLGIIKGATEQHEWSLNKMKTVSLACWAVTDGMMLYHLTTEGRPRHFFRDRSIESLKILLEEG